MDEGPASAFPWSLSCGPGSPERSEHHDNERMRRPDHWSKSAVIDGRTNPNSTGTRSSHRSCGFVRHLLEMGKPENLSEERPSPTRSPTVLPPVERTGVGEDGEGAAERGDGPGCCSAPPHLHSILACSALLHRGIRTTHSTVQISDSTGRSQPRLRMRWQVNWACASPIGPHFDSQK